MPFLLRVELPDVPGSLGRVATAIGMAGGDIEAIEIVEKRDGTALDDVLLETAEGTMPDSIVSACNALDGVEVLFISRYPAGGNLTLDLEAVEELTAAADALDKLVELLPRTFRADWAARVHRAKGVVHGTSAAPDELEFVDLEAPRRLEPETVDDVTLYAAARLDGNEIVVIGRRGGPEFVDSEIARLGHLSGLAVTIAGA